MNDRYSVQHEEAELSHEITRNYEQYIDRPQERKPNGHLIDPLAETFEQRMNKALESYGDLVKFTGQAVLLEPGKAVTS